MFSFFPLGVFWRQFVQGGAEPEAWMYMSVAVPAACIAGPLGSMLASHCHRQVLAWAVYILDTIALVIIANLSSWLPCLRNCNNMLKDYTFSDSKTHVYFLNPQIWPSFCETCVSYLVEQLCPSVWHPLKRVFYKKNLGREIWNWPSVCVCGGWGQFF